MENPPSFLSRTLVPLGEPVLHAMVDRHVAEPMDWTQHRD
jgi:hypothetical protein